MTDDLLYISDEHIAFGIEKAVVVYVKDWTANYLVGDCKGCVVALIPYQSEDGRQNALSIARQIIASNLDVSSLPAQEPE